MCEYIHIYTYKYIYASTFFVHRPLWTICKQRPQVSSLFWYKVRVIYIKHKLTSLLNLNLFW